MTVDHCARHRRARTTTCVRSRAAAGTGAGAVETWHRDDAVVVAIAGQFDLALADPVRAVLTRAISERRQRLVVDLTQLTFIDSSGLHTIADAYTLCRDSGPAMTIRPGPPNVQLVFAMTKLLDHLPFEV